MHWILLPSFVFFVICKWGTSLIVFSVDIFIHWCFYSLKKNINKKNINKKKNLDYTLSRQELANKPREQKSQEKKECIVYLEI